MLNNSPRDYTINIRGSTLQQRAELRDFLLSIGEPVYEETTVHTKISYDYNYFQYTVSSWSGSVVMDNALSIQDFVDKFKHLIKE